MAAPQATGRVVRDRDGLELIVERRVPAPAAEVWAWLTVSSNTSKWIGKYSGKPAVGGTIDLLAEGGSGSERVAILECEPEDRFTLEWSVADDVWRVTVSLAETDGATWVYLSQRLSEAREAGSIGPGWEYYLDRLLAARSGSAMPEVGEYFPAQRPYYERLAMDGDPAGWPTT